MSNSTDIVTRTVAVPSRVGQATAVEQSRAAAEVLAAVTVAQQMPRDLDRAWAEMKTACSRPSLAARAFYTVQGRGTNRPSIHLARELARIWGNLDYGVRELDRDDEQARSEIQAYAWDQQTNVRSTRSVIVPHARMKGGARQPLTDLGDVYLNNQNVGARAVRECIFTVLPDDFIAEAEGVCRATIKKGDGQPLEKRIADMLATFAGLSVTEALIEARLGRGRAEWTAEDLADLGIVFSSIKRRETTVEDEFPAERVTAAEIQAQAASAPASASDPAAKEEAPQAKAPSKAASKATSKPVSKTPAAGPPNGGERPEGVKDTRSTAEQVEDRAWEAGQLPVEDPPAGDWPETRTPPADPEVTA